MKRNILLQFDNDDDLADVLVAIRPAKTPAERAKAIAGICRGNLPKPAPNGSPLPGQQALPIMADD